MDERLQRALEHANYNATLSTTRKNLELRYRNSLLHSQNGGTFTVSPALITFVSSLVARDHDDVVLIDDKNRPIMIRGLKDFLAKIETVYFEASNAYFADYENLRKARSVKALTGL